MPTIHDQVSAQFAAYEQRARGWQIYDDPVDLEPPFRPFTGYKLKEAVDDGRRSTVGSRLLSGLSQWLSNQPKALDQSDTPDEEPTPSRLVRDDLVEFQCALPANLNLPRENFEALLATLTHCQEPLSLELLANHEQVALQIATSRKDSVQVRRQLVAHFPDPTFLPRHSSLEGFADPDAFQAIVEFGLGREIFFPLTTTKFDPFVGLIGAMGELSEGEAGLYQVLFQPCRHPWSESILGLVSDAYGKAIFTNELDFVRLAKDKVARPLYAVVVRLGAKSNSIEGAWEILRDLAGPLRAFGSSSGNELIPLRNDNYPCDEHIQDLIYRQSRRTGMLLNIDELTGFVHLPSSSIRTSRFRRQATNTKAAPRIVIGKGGILLGENTHADESHSVVLSADQRTRHLHTIGASGTGKSTFLFNLIEQDIASGEGIAILDPHGDLIDRVLGCIPEDRIKDVILVDPSDETASIGFNILSAHSDLEKTLLASDLVSVFQRLSQSWGDQMEGVLRNAILAFLESSQGGTLSDLRRFLLDAKYRERFLTTVTDPDIQFYWRKGFSQLTGGKSIGPVLTRLETFLSPKPLRYMVAQKSNRLDFADVLDSGKIFLARLSQGAIGRENAYLLGSLFMSKFQQTAMARQRQDASVRRDFWIYCDEFQNFITPSMAEILSGARKYRIGLILAHQELRQLERDREVASAVLSNPYTRVVFRVGDDDARKLESGFSSFSAHDLQNLGTGEAIVRVERSDFDFNLKIPAPVDPGAEFTSRRKDEVIAASRLRYATPRAEIEATLRSQFENEEPEAKPTTARTKTTSSPPSPRPAAEESSPLPTPSFPPPTEDPEPKPESPKPVPETYPPASGSGSPTVRQPSSDPGRGGEQHKTIQKRLKESAEKLGYLVTTEKPILDRSGSVDLALEHPQRSIAVEITITTTIDHEVKNVMKCFRAGFQSVAVVSSSETKLRNMREAVTGALGPELAARVGYYQPDALLAHLEQLAKDDATSANPTPGITIRRGYTVKRSIPKLTPEELRNKEEAGHRSIAAAMKLKMPPK